MRILDAHFHLWRIGGPGVTWPGPDLPRLHRNFTTDDLRGETVGLNFAGGVLIQSQADDRDTDWMLAIDDPLVRGVVGWADLSAPDAPQRIATLAAQPTLKGLRPMLQGIADTDWILGTALEPAIEAMIAHGLRFDALIQPRHLRALRDFATRWPDLPIVIDHAAKPYAATNTLDPWRDEIAALATLPSVWCKLSGLRTEQAPGQNATLLAPYVAHLSTIFDDRLMWGSDWPVLVDTGDTYSTWVQTAIALTDPARHERLLFSAAAAFYGVTTEP